MLFWLKIVEYRKLNNMTFWLRLSRPRFWIYLLGPYLIGIVSASRFNSLEWQDFVLIFVFGMYFTFPANVMLYGVNDVFDYETDRLNPKKQAYESWLDPKWHQRVILVSFFFFLPFLTLAFVKSFILGALFGLFLFLSIFYSTPPIRFKARPFFDALSNVLYIIPGIFGYYFVMNVFPPAVLLVSAGLWTMAMHAYSAIPDIEADQKAHIRTVATVLQEKNTVVFCALLYAGSGILSYATLGIFGLCLIGVYLVLMALSFFRKEKPIMFYYRLFPVINLISGAGLFFFALLQRF